MTITYCDITKKPIENATTAYAWENRQDRYDTVLDKDLFPDGMDKLQSEILKEMEKKTEFSFMEHKRVLTDKLQQLAK